MKWFALIAVVITGSLLIYGVSDFPDWGDAQSPANAGAKSSTGEPIGESVSQFYITETGRLTHVPNLVTAVLADYRGYDTMFETVVIFAAGMAIFAILRVLREDKHTLGPPAKDTTADGDHGRIIVGTTCKILIPVIQLFSLYVVAHGHYSPGGGFQGGVMLGASFILLAVAKDLGSALTWFTEKRFMTLACVGILIYAGFGLMAQFLQRHFLDYGVLHVILPKTDEVMARSHSMLGVEIGVAFTVTAIMFAIYANLSSRGELKRGL
ncbi:MAG: hypothetical protein HKN23_14885 [Verrucomicrobiales bacterium]|nr:hypothetical protein [Verrucomicrobiales bacterium]